MAESFWFTLEKGRVREDAREKLLEVVAVARVTAQNDSACCVDAEPDWERAETALAAFASAAEYLEEASPSFRRRRPHAEDEFPYTLQALVVGTDGAVTFEQNSWAGAYDLATVSEILSDFLEPGAVVYAEADREGQFSDAYEVTGAGEIAPLQLAWVRQDETLALTV